MYNSYRDELANVAINDPITTTNTTKVSKLLKKLLNLDACAFVCLVVYRNALCVGLVFHLFITATPCPCLHPVCFSAISCLCLLRASLPTTPSWQVNQTKHLLLRLSLSLYCFYRVICQMVIAIQ